MIRFIRSVFHRIDRYVLPLCVAFSGLSILLLLGIANMPRHVIGPRTVIMQVIASVLGVIGALILAHLDYESLAKWWKIYLPAAVLLMLLTFTPLGQTRNDAIETNRSWLNLGFATIQPSEFLKIAFILSLAYHLSKVHTRLGEPRVLLPVAAHAIFPVLLILLQKDTGVAMVMLFIVVIMVIMAGLPSRWILVGLAGLGVFIPIAWKFLLNDYQKVRFLLLKDPEQYALVEAYQQLQGRISFGSGQLFGIGIFSDAHRYVPDMYNDMIFTFLGESLGFLGSALVIGGYIWLLARILQIGLTCKNYLGRFLCVGVFAMLASQVLINVGMCLLVSPSVGVTLPLLSAGASSVLSVYCGIGLVLSVRYYEKQNMFT